MNDPYVILGVARDASYEDIEATYYQKRAAALTGSEKEDVETRLGELDSAFQALQAPTVGKPRVTTVTAPPTSTLNTLANMNLAPTPIEGRVCPQCSMINPGQAVRCQNCFEPLTQPCPHCGRPLAVNQAVCDRCQTVVAEYRLDIEGPPARAAKRIDSERADLAEYAQDVGIVVDAERRAEIRFWFLVVVFIIIIAIIVISLASIGSAWR